MPDTVVDAVPETAGLRAVRAKVYAEASSVCPRCGRRHLLDSRCAAAPEVVHDTEPFSVESPLDAPAPHAHPFVPASASERDDTRARRMVGSVITFLGLDPASFGEVDDGSVRGPAADAGTPGLWPAPEDVPQPFVGPPRPRAQRVIAFLGFDVDGVDSARAADDDHIAPPATTSTDENEVAPREQSAGTESLTRVDASAAVMVMASDDAPRRYWRRADDDILYRPSRRPRSPHRTWRDRVWPTRPPRTRAPRQ